MNGQVSRAGFSKVRLEAQRRILKFNLDCSRGDQCSLFYYFDHLFCCQAAKMEHTKHKLNKPNYQYFIMGNYGICAIGNYWLGSGEMNIYRLE